ncbi:30S ribosomal protein S17 [Pseudenhygromyxa sp. WMMC2535]|uniref:30S ribosomal protein S17 n=1 Tax=Pseudenhygromyxa sp. WMMC2535 TaxID=2712867 RepID=UPI0015526724|nr:30S ribosomal protein S17 [Pseudenhygromyxa sp. WMMC2535]NVB36813.1 30S ribosomal protein S17 [Pseudenhygromyxa sp. WMMC2535]
MSEANNASQSRRRTLLGQVVSDKMDKTVVVQVTRRYKHPRYKKYVQERIRYKAHDEANEARTGDTVRIIESRPRSKDKRWAVQAILERGVG